MVCPMAERPIAISRRSQLQTAQVLRSRDAALSLRCAPYGTRTQLLHRRRFSATHVDARLQRASSHGMGLLRTSRGKRRHSEQHPAARLDSRQYRQHESSDEASGFCLRLGPRSYNLLAGLLSLESVVLSAALSAWVGVSQKKQSQLVSAVRYGARQ